MYYRIDKKLCHLHSAAEATRHFYAAVLTAKEWDSQKELLGFPAYADHRADNSHICRADVYAKYIFGNIVVPDKEQILFRFQKFPFYMNENGIVFIDENNIADKIIGSMVPKYENHYMNPEFFLYSFLSEFLNDDIALLEKYENTLFAMEENALKGHIVNPIPRLLKVRRELTRLRYYYEQFEDMARELEGNRQNYFDVKEINYMHLLGDRTNRLAGMAQQSIDYCHTLRDIYNSELDHKQNQNMQLLTVITSIFFPLTLITGWYGMNFKYMPELGTRYGYLVIIFVSLGVILGEILFINKKKIK